MSEPRVATKDRLDDARHHLARAAGPNVLADAGQPPPAAPRRSEHAWRCASAGRHVPRRHRSSGGGRRGRTRHRARGVHPRRAPPAGRAAALVQPRGSAGVCGHRGSVAPAIAEDHHLVHADENRALVSHAAATDRMPSLCGLTVNRRAVDPAPYSPLSQRRAARRRRSGSRAAEGKIPPIRHDAASGSRGRRRRIARRARPFSPLESMLSAPKLRPARVRVLPGGQAMCGRYRNAGTPSQESRSR